MAETRVPSTRAAARAASMRSRTRFKRLSLATLASAAAVAVGLGSAGATTALLSSQSNLAGATISAGTLGIRVNGAASAALGNWNVSPATPIARAYQVSNIGDAPATLTTNIAVSTPMPALASHTQATLAPVANSAACTTGLSGTTAGLNGYSFTDPTPLNGGASRWYCLRISLPTGTPGSVSGQNLSFTATVNGVQHAG